MRKVFQSVRHGEGCKCVGAITALIVVALFLNACGWLGETFEEYRKSPHQERALRLLQEGRLEDARLELEKYLAIDPDDQEVRLTYLDVLYKLGDFPQVIAEADLLLEQDPLSSSALIHRGLAQRELGRMGQAVSDFLKAASGEGIGNKERVFAYFSALDLLIQQERYVEARQVIADLDSVSDTSFELEYRRGLVLERLGELDEAILALKEALELAGNDPDRLKAYRLLAETAQKAGDPELAKKALTGGLSIDPKDLELTRAMAHLAYRQRDYTEAASWMQSALAVRPDLDDQEFLGEALGKQGDYAGAARAIDEALQMTENKEDLVRLHMKSGNLHFRFHQYSKSAHSYEAGLKLQRSVPGLLALARTLEQQGKVQKAAIYYKEAVSLQPTGLNHYQLGQAHLQLGENEEAIEELELALKQGLSPSLEGEAHKQLGFAYQARGEHREASIAFQKAKQQLPNDLAVYAALGDSLVSLEESDQAIEVLQTRLRMSEDAETHYQLGMVYALRGEASVAADHLLTALEGDLLPDQQATAHKQLAFAYRTSEEWERAVTEFQAALAIKPQDAGALAGLGQCYLDLGRYDQAAKALEASLQIENNSAVWLALAQTHAFRGEEEVAIQIYWRQVRQLNGEPEATARLLGAIAALESRKGDWAEAARLYLEAFETSGGTDSSLLAQALESQILSEQWDEALVTCERLLAMQGLDEDTEAETWANQAFILSALGQSEGSAQAFRNAISLGRDDWRMRQALGLELLKLEQWEDATRNFQQSMQWNPSSMTAEYLGRSYKASGKPGLAAYFLRNALLDAEEPEPDRERRLLNELGYLLAEQSEFSAAADAFKRSRQLQEDPEIALREGKVLRLAGSHQQARNILQTLNSDSLTMESKAERLDELAKLQAADNQLSEAIDLVTEASRLSPSPSREFELGRLYRTADKNAQAIPHFEKAVELDSGDTDHLVALGHSYLEARQFEEAAATLEKVVAREPDYLSVYEDLGYAYMRLSKNGEAVQRFRQGIDNESFYPVYDEEDQENLEKRTLSLREEVSKIQDWLDIDAYLSYRTGEGPPPGQGTLLGGGVIPSQGGLELAIRPPVIGFRNNRVFQVFARTLWGFQPDSIRFDKDSFQGGFGVRYKPLGSQNLFISVEKLFRIGENAEDNWLLRAMYSWTSGLGRRSSYSKKNYTLVFGDLGYFLDDPGVVAFFGEFRQGFNVRVAPGFVMTPHLVVDGRILDERLLNNSYLEGGGGVSLRYMFNQNRYESYRSQLEFLLQYKAGGYIRQPPDVSDNSFNGFVFSLVFHF